MTPDEFPTETAPGFTGYRQMLWLGGGFLVMLFLALAMVLRDNSRRAEIEQTVETSPFGDTIYLTLPEAPPAPPYPAVASLNGQPLYPVNYKRYEKSEVALERAGRDEATGVSIYRELRQAKDSKDPEAAAIYFLKLGPREYLKVSSRQVSE